MAAELGHYALILALVISLTGAVLPLGGAAVANRGWMRWAVPAALWLAILSTLCLGTLTRAFLADDFSVLNVARHSNTALPWYYKAAAVWGSHEGSILFWVTVLSWWTAAVALRVRHIALIHQARILGVLCAVAFGFYAFILFTSDPFLRLFPPSPDGADLNPLLQDPGMIFHPPLLYLGYVGFAVPFAYAMAALMNGRLTVQWAQWMRPWTVGSWMFLTLGIGLGCYWSYYELGWGGWWGWDPVENASLLPWLTGTALLHSLLVVVVRGSLKVWSVFLALLTFALSLFGTFIVRSGVISSLHSFAADPDRGLFILFFLGLVIIASFVLFLLRAKSVALATRFSFLSRESFLVAGNLVLLAMMGAVLLGTMYPFILETLGGGKISVGAPYFNKVFGLLMIPLAVLAALGSLLAWGRAAGRTVWVHAGVLAVVALVAGAALSWVAGPWHWVSSLGAALSFFLLFVAVDSALWHVRNGRGLTLSWWAMQAAHVGVACMVLGAVMSACHQVEREVPVYPGDKVQLTQSVTLRYDGWKELRAPTYTAARGTISVLNDQGAVVETLTPEKRNYDSAMGVTMTEAAIWRRVTEDVYVALGTQTKTGDGWVIRAYVKPAISFLWLGILLMTLGGCAALGAGAQRRLQEKSHA